MGFLLLRLSVFFLRHGAVQSSMQTSFVIALPKRDIQDRSQYFK